MNDYFDFLFLNYDLSSSLKEIGFKEKCVSSYYTHVDANKSDKFDYRGKSIFEYSNSLDDYIINTNEDYYIARPTIDQVIKWFREEHKLYLTTIPKGKEDKWSFMLIDLDKHENITMYDLQVSGGVDYDENGNLQGYGDGLSFDTFQQATNAGIEYTINYLKQRTL
jgi:hypothetical protein